MAEQAVASFLDKFRHIFPQPFPDRQGLHEMQSQALLDFLATAPHGCNKHIASYFRLSPSTISRFRSSKDPKLLVSGPQFETVVVNDEQDPEIGGSGYGEGVATSLQLQDSVTAVPIVEERAWWWSGTSDDLSRLPAPLAENQCRKRSHTFTGKDTDYGSAPSCPYANRDFMQCTEFKMEESGRDEDPFDNGIGAKIVRLVNNSEDVFRNSPFAQSGMEALSKMRTPWKGLFLDQNHPDDTTEMVGHMPNNMQPQGDQRYVSSDSNLHK